MKTKKVSIILIILIAVLVLASATVWFLFRKDEQEGRNISELEFENLDLDRDSALVVLCYEGDDSIIFCNEYGVWGYDLREERLTFGIDIVKLFNNIVYVQGNPEDGYNVWVEPSPDGKELELSCSYPEKTGRETYLIDVPTLTYQKGVYRDMNNPFNWMEDAVGELIFGPRLGDSVYIRGDKTYELFK